MSSDEGRQREQDQPAPEGAGRRDDAWGEAGADRYGQYGGAPRYGQYGGPGHEQYGEPRQGQSTSSAEAYATRRATSPVAGSNTSPDRVELPGNGPPSTQCATVEVAVADAVVWAAVIVGLLVVHAFARTCARSAGMTCSPYSRSVSSLLSCMR
ncbi:hypothetical protein [Georgenia sp. SUBG003]|uniref:hypothetical protein n=1 Tax=Georgenia sp. SUBG003 TaxID=1497974 RepID=UPI003AB5886A